MNAKLQTMIKEAERLSTEVETLLAEPTQENLLKAQDLNAKFKGLADDIELFRKAECDALAAKEFLAQPIRDVPFETGVSVVGMRPAGAAEFAQEKGATARFQRRRGARRRPPVARHRRAGLQSRVPNVPAARREGAHRHGVEGASGGRGLLRRLPRAGGLRPAAAAKVADARPASKTA